MQNAPTLPPIDFGALTNGAGEARTAITDLMAGVDDAQPKVENFAKTIGDTMASAFTGFADAVLSGVPALEALSDMLGNLGEQLLNSAISNFFTGLFGGTLFGSPFRSTGGGVATLGNVGMFATGGVTNEPAIFGESGPEAAVPLPDGRSIPVTLSGGAAGGGDSRVLVQLDQGLIGKVLQQAHDDAVQVVKTNSPAAVATAQRDKWLG
jgi:hypothetical protein